MKISRRLDEVLDDLEVDTNWESPGCPVSLETLINLGTRDRSVYKRIDHAENEPLHAFFRPREARSGVVERVATFDTNGTTCWGGGVRRRDTLPSSKIAGSQGKLPQLPNGQVFPMEKPQGARRCEYTQRTCNLTFDYADCWHGFLSFSKARGGWEGWICFGIGDEIMHVLEQLGLTELFQVERVPRNCTYLACSLARLGFCVLNRLPRLKHSIPRNNQPSRR